MILKADCEDIINDIKKGNKKAFSQVYNAYSDKLCKYIYSLSSDYKQAEDIVQDTLLDIWIKRENLNINTSLNNYLYRSVHNKFINQYKKSIRYKTLIDELRLEAIVELEELTETHKEIRLTALEKAIEQLPEKRRKVFKLSKLLNYKYKEIAVMCNISENTVESQMRKAMIFIRKQMSDLKFISIIFVLQAHILT